MYRIYLQVRVSDPSLQKNTLQNVRPLQSKTTFTLPVRTSTILFFLIFPPKNPGGGGVRKVTQKDQRSVITTIHSWGKFIKTRLGPAFLTLRVQTENFPRNTAVMLQHSSPLKRGLQCPKTGVVHKVQKKKFLFRRSSTPLKF